ncbi:UPF0187-domain-containing protein [Neoconidiobolus thromboides FSU 785]|nr:UPF0187-domain-containing protein [Neoconidiobolus thromboides FSU 785]
MDQPTTKYNPFKTTAFHYKGSVLIYVLPKAIFFTIWSVSIWAIEVYGNLSSTVIKTIAFNNALIVLLGLVISLLLVFRTNTAYDRYWEGRRLWSDMTMIIRSTARTIWVQVEQVDSFDKDMKLQVIHLLVAYAYACKHNIRGEFGEHASDLENFLSHLTEGNGMPMSPESTRSNSTNSVTKLIKKTFDKKDNDFLPILITHKITLVIDYWFKNEKIAPAVATILLNNLNVMVTSYAGFERILDTPIPMAYAIHLSQCVWLFCLLLPFQLLFLFSGVYKFFAILFTLVSAFTIFGIINIGEEIENPFGYDANDLPLNEYCEILNLEINQMIKKVAPNVKDWVFNNDHIKYIKKTFSIKSKNHTKIIIN